jgi:CPA2 family monovalent cation:H+ antiporter-2
MDRLRAAGAAEIVPEVVEGSLMLATHAMLLVGIPLGRVLRHVREVRTERYRLMRAFFHGRSDAEESIEDEHAPRLASILLETGAAAIGKPLRELDLDKLRIEVSAIRRRRQRDLKPGGDVMLESGDVLVLLGTPEDLAAAEIRLLQG